MHLRSTVNDPQRAALVDHNRPPLVCTRCGERIGVYEPLWLELADGILRSSSFLSLGEHELPEPARLWHHGCLAPVRLPPGSG
jgi:hypothetical protein